MSDSGEEQVDFELFDDGDRPFYFDRPPEQRRPPALRPDQMLLPVAALDMTFVVPRWTVYDVPAQWTFLVAELDGGQLTELTGRFLFRRGAETPILDVWVSWSGVEFGFEVKSGAPDDGRPVVDVSEADTALLRTAALARVQRFADLMSLVGVASRTPATRALMLEAIGVGPGRRTS